MTNATAPPEILIVDDHQADVRLVQEALRNGTDGRHIHVVRDRHEAMAFLHREAPFTSALAPDVILVGLNPPDHAGRDAFEEIRQSEFHPPVIILSRSTAEPAGRYFRAGAVDYIVKGDLSPLPLAIASAVAVRVPLRKLSPRQVEVLQLIAEGLATRDIARRLVVSGKTVEAHRAELMRRLEIRTVAGLVRYALRAGLVELGSQ